MPGSVDEERGGATIRRFGQDARRRREGPLRDRRSRGMGARSGVAMLPCVTTFEWTTLARRSIDTRWTFPRWPLDVQALGVRGVSAVGVLVVRVF
jgi:hypothetical protein